jgi:hypothetical protein
VSWLVKATDKPKEETFIYQELGITLNEICKINFDYNIVVVDLETSRICSVPYSTSPLFYQQYAGTIAAQLSNQLLLSSSLFVILVRCLFLFFCVKKTDT